MEAAFTLQKYTALVAVLGVLGCTPFSSADTPSAPNATVDAGWSDGTITTLTDGSTPPTSFSCSGFASIFCDDFEGEAPSKVWSSRYILGAGDVERQRGGPRGGENALLARSGLASGETHAFVEHQLTNLPKVVRYEYDISIAEIPSGSDGVPLNRFTVGSLAVTLTVNRSGGAVLSTKVGADTYGSFELPDLGIDRWRHVAMTIDRRGDPSRVSVAFDGVTVVDGAKVSVAASPNPDQGRAMAGIYYLKPGDGPWAVRVDNAVVTAVN